MSVHVVSWANQLRRERASGVWMGAAAPLKKFGIIGNQNVVVACLFYYYFQVGRCEIEFCIFR